MTHSLGLLLLWTVTGIMHVFVECFDQLFCERTVVDVRLPPNEVDIVFQGVLQGLKQSASA